MRSLLFTIRTYTWATKCHDIIVICSSRIKVAIVTAGIAALRRYRLHTLAEYVAHGKADLIGRIWHARSDVRVSGQC